MRPGTLLNKRYEVESLLAEGGMARVFRARDKLLDRPVAVKVLREQYAADHAFVQRFQQEARAAAGLAHPNIVGVYDVGTEGGAHFIVNELVDGPNLKQLIQREAPFSAARAIDFAQQMLAALSFAHQRSIVHRDIKPQNILVTAQGHIKVADFGIARAASSMQLTETGIVMGSVHYCAPEQAMGKGATAAADVYAVGVVLYEMLCGQVPFESDNALGVALKHVQEPPPPLRERAPHVPPALEGIVLRAMAKEPAKRFASAEEMFQTLRDYRQLGDQDTAPLVALTAHDLARGPSPSRQVAPRLAGRPTVNARPQPVKTRRAKRRTLDWMVVLFSVLILAMIVGWLPIAAGLYDLYVRPLPSVPTSAPALAPTRPPVAPTATAPIPAASPAAVGTPSATPRLVAVPSLVSMRSNDAFRDLEKAGLGITYTEGYSEQYAQGVVMAQSPSAGVEMPSGSTVSIVISRGSNLVRVPEVITLLLEEAKARLTQLGLRAESSLDWNGRVAKGRVIEQHPLPNSAVVSGTVVSLLVSNGPPPATATPAGPTPTPAPLGPTPTRDPRVSVPNLVGQPEARARDTLLAAGLATGYTNYQKAEDVSPASRAFFNSIPKGAVVSQDIQPGTLVNPGTTVLFAVRRD